MGTVSRPGPFRGVPLAVALRPPNIQKKPLEEKGVNIQIGLFSSQDEKLVSNSIYKKHTNRYLTATSHLSSTMHYELPSNGVRWVFHRADWYCGGLVGDLSADKLPGLHV